MNSDNRLTREQEERIFRALTIALAWIIGTLSMLVGIHQLGRVIPW